MAAFLSIVTLARMRRRAGLLLVWAACGWAGTASAQLEIMASGPPESFFSGAAREVPVTIHNPVNHSVEGKIRVALYQATSDTAVLLAEKPWKKLQVLPGQTVIETTRVDFPDVRAETAFIVQWIEGTNRVMGRKMVRVFPTNLLEELKPLAGGLPMGIYDPSNQLKPLLRGANLAYQSLEDSPMNDFAGTLAVLDTGADDGLARVARTLAKKGHAIVWIQPPGPDSDELRPSFYTILEKNGALVSAQAELVASLAENPQSQLHLIALCRQAVHPAPPAWPDQSNNPSGQ